MFSALQNIHFMVEFTMTKTNFNVNSSILGKLGPFPDQYLEKSPNLDQSPEKTKEVGALQYVRSFYLAVSQSN